MVDDVVSVLASCARLQNRRRIQVSHSRAAKVRNQLACIFKMEAIIELQPIGGKRRGLLGGDALQAVHNSDDRHSRTFEVVCMAFRGSGAGTPPRLRCKASLRAVRWQPRQRLRPVRRFGRSLYLIEAAAKIEDWSSARLIVLSELLARSELRVSHFIARKDSLWPLLVN